MLNNKRAVILNCAYGQFGSERVKRLFADLVELKIDGYVEEYGFGALPVDTTDFIGTHIAICDEVEGRLIPAMAFKSISPSRCREFGIPFTPVELLKGRLAKESYSDFLKIVETKGNSISFDSSWTVSSKYKLGSCGAQLSLLEAMAGLLTSYHQDQSIGLPEFLVSGTVQVRADSFFAKMGAQTIGDDPYFSHPSIKGGECSILHLKDFSPFAMRAAKKHKKLWENRLVFEPTEPNLESAPLAA